MLLLAKGKIMLKNLALCALLAVSTQSKADDYLLYFMGGQSNMEGFGFNKDLPAQYKKPVENTLLFFGNPVADNTKINQWDNFQTTVRAALANNDIDGDGEADTLVPAGIIWMQGEADAYHEQASKVYLANLTNLMNDMKMTFGNKELPIILGRIEDSGKTPQTRMMPYIESVWDAQKKYVQSNANAHLVAFDEPVEFIEDKWHYKSNYYIKLGNLFAEKAAETLAK